MSVLPITIYHIYLHNSNISNHFTYVLPYIRLPSKQLLTINHSSRVIFEPLRKHKYTNFHPSSRVNTTQQQKHILTINAMAFKAVSFAWWNKDKTLSVIANAYGARWTVYCADPFCRCWWQNVPSILIIKRIFTVDEMGCGIIAVEWSERARLSESAL